jgi:hypothetical protein
LQASEEELVMESDQLNTVGWPDRVLEILRLYLMGWSLEEIAQHVGLTRQSVANITSKYRFTKLREQRLQAKVKRAADEFLAHEENVRSGVQSVFGKPPVRVTVNFELHTGQKEVVEAIEKNFASETPAAIVTLVAGRGWGKTALLGKMLVEFLEANPHAQVLWVSHFASSCLSLIEDFFKAYNDQNGLRMMDDHDEQGNKVWEFVGTKSGLVLRWWNGATVTFRSAENPEAIVSRGYHRIIMDEAALIADENVFKQRILGVARKKGIKIFLITTPRGKNWLYNLYLKGLDPSDTNYLSLRQPYTKNPYFNPTQASFIKDIPEFLFRQEYLAEFIEDGRCAFSGIDRVTVGDEISFPGSQQEWAPELGDVSGRRFVVGLDLAKSIDFTVFYGMDLDSGECVYYRRMNRTDYKQVLELASVVCARLNGATLVYDKTGVGAGIADFVENYGIVSEPFTFTYESKSVLIQKLMLAIEHEAIQIPNITTIQKELRSYEAELTKTGKLTYNAASGFHDDCVIALALANLHREENAQVVMDCQLLDRIVEFNRGGARSFYQEMLDDND